ncbi:MAG: hypothetical protein EOP00_07165 [Pedobacter sp.]|nr:MAG: hypothetical protein EOP00_07165 [Pedobacter sp.]
MKIFIALLTFIILPFTAFTQKLNDANSFEKAIALSQKNKKPLLLIIAIPAKYATNTTVNSALYDAEVVKKIKENFVVFETDREDTTIAPIITTYKIRSFPSYIFMHATKDVFHSDFGLSSSKNKYLTMVDKALELSKEKSITDLEKEYLANKNDNTILKKLIELRRKNGITNNAELIELYANNLRISDLNDYQTILFILQAGPLADGNAYKLTFTNREIRQNIYKNEPVQVRVDINNAIIQNTLINAVKTKNVLQAQAAANITRSTNSTNYQAGIKNAANNMLYYYRSVKDTSNYIRNAIQYYDAYYMNISSDSIKRIEARQRQTAIERSRPMPMANSKTVSREKLDSLMKANPGSIRTETRTTTTAVSMANSYANELNNAAWTFYETGTKNINHLLKAVTWSTRSIELNATSGYYDTLAHLFYKLGYFEQAIKTQQTAINQAKIEGRPHENLQDVLRKIKSKEL